MYGLKIAGMDRVSFGPVPVLMVVEIIWSTVIRFENTSLNLTSLASEIFFSHTNLGPE